MTKRALLFCGLLSAQLACCCLAAPAPPLLYHRTTPAHPLPPPSHPQFCATASDLFGCDSCKVMEKLYKELDHEFECKYIAPKPSTKPAPKPASPKPVVVVKPASPAVKPTTKPAPATKPVVVVVAAKSG